MACNCEPQTFATSRFPKYVLRPHIEMKHGENTTVECPIDPWHDGGVRGVRLDSRPGLIPWELHYFHLSNDGYYLVSILKLEKHETSILLSSHDICSAFRRSGALGKINAGT